MTSDKKLTYGDIEYCGGGKISVPIKLKPSNIHYEKKDEFSGLISILDSCMIRIPKSYDKIPPEWWDLVIQQSKEHKDNPRSPLLIKMPDEKFVVAGNYIESFFYWSKVNNCGTPYYDRFVGGTVLSNPHWPENINNIMSERGIQSSTVASRYISPETEYTKKLKLKSEEAKKSGFDIPNKKVFETRRTLMPHQELAVRVLAHKGGGILADDVGSGKSAMFICGYLSVVQYIMATKGRKLDDSWPLVIVTKNSLIDATERECRIWFKGCKTHVVKGKSKNSIPSDVNVILCPYPVLSSQLNNIIMTNPKGVVFDESHMVKNKSSKRTQSAIKLSRSIRRKNEFPYTVCASGTPMPNRPAELWTQLMISGIASDVVKCAEEKQKFPDIIKLSVRRTNKEINEDFHTSWKKAKESRIKEVKVTDSMKFDIRYCDGKKGNSGMSGGPYGWNNQGNSNVEELSRVLRECGMIRRKKSEFMTPLPLLHQRFIRCNISDFDKKRYDKAENEFRKYLIESKVKNKAEAEKWTQRRIDNEIKLIMRKTRSAGFVMQMTELRGIVGEAKVEAIADWVERFFSKDPLIVGTDNSRNKLIIFAHHKKVQERIINHPKIVKHGVLSIQAGEKDVNSKVDEFQDPKSKKKIIVCYSEAREGLTLTAAKDVLVTELPFVPSWLIQMGGRCWARVSEMYPPHEAYLHYAVADLKIDKYLEDMIREKKWLHKTIIDGEFASSVINEEESNDI